MSDIQRPLDDPYALVGSSWPSESESAYTVAESNASDASTTASTQAESARDAESKMDDERGKAASAVSGRYNSVSTQLGEQSRNFTTISSWMLDAAGKVGKAKNNIASLVLTGTQEIRDALDREMSGTSVIPSSAELTTKYRNEIQGVNFKLSVDLDAIGHSLHGDAGSSNTPSYVSVPLTPTPEHQSPTAEVAAYNHGDQPHVEPHQLPEMPRATTTTNTELPSTTSAPSAPTAPASPHGVNPTLSNLISGSAPSGTPSSPSTSAKSASGPTSGIPAGQQQQAPEQHQDSKSPVLRRIPSIGLPDLPAAATSIATAVSSATAHQLPTASTTTPAAQAPASTGFTPGTSGAAPVTPTPPVGLSPVGGLPTPPPVVQAPLAPQGTPATPSPAAPAPSPQSPAPTAPRGPAADIGWLQRTYGLSPSLELPKPEAPVIPSLFITDLPGVEVRLHCALASLRHQFERAGWSQPLAVGLIKRGFEVKTVYVAADGVSIHPQGVLLPRGVTPMDEMTVVPSASRLEGSLMVTEKLLALVPRGWDIECLLSTVPGEADNQSTEQFQALIESEELLPCTVSRGDSTVTADGALRVFARAAIGSGGCGELDVESARLRGARWIGVQPAGYRDVLARYHLADAAEAMSAGRWGEAAYASEKHLSIRQMKSKWHRR